MRIALFTPYSPDIGGGAALLKSLFSELHGFDLTWYYVSPVPDCSNCGVWLGPQLMGGPAISDLIRSSNLWVRRKSSRLSEIVARMEADVYWVVAANEAVLVGLTLAAMGKPVHVTVHDDPRYMVHRSTRYRILEEFISVAFSELLKAARSVDVVSEAMRDLYREQYGVEALIVFRYLERLPVFEAEPRNDGVLRVGHIGTVYQAAAFREFVKSLRAYGHECGRLVKVVKIGRSVEFEKVQEQYPESIEDLGELPEEVAVQRLHACDFLYCMYPNGPRFEMFRRTSQPMKLTTYTQAQRPIFAHTPEDSTLASVVRKYHIGSVCSSFDQQGITEMLKTFQFRDTFSNHFEKVRSELFDVRQAKALRNWLESAGVRFA